jgi:transposase-like protein
MIPEEQAGNTTVDPEVKAQKERRVYSAEYRRQILKEADDCKLGEVGALLRREGLYSSHLAKWRGQRAAGEMAGLASKQRGKKADPQARELVQLRKQVVRLNEKLVRAELIMTAQKKLADLLGLPMASLSEPNE